MLQEQEIVAEQEEIALFIRYGVAETEQLQALALLERYGHDFLGLTLLRFYYTSLPDVHDESLNRIVLMTQHNGLFLFALSSRTHDYLCLADSRQQAVWLGEFAAGLDDPALLTSLGFADAEAFRAFCSDLKACPEYQPISSADSGLCPSCFVPVGEIHRLGCPVEVCPWCDAQFNYCSCRYEHLGVEEIDSESQLEQLEQILNDKGRVPFAREHAPSFPVAVQSDEDSDLAD
jgi:hypothetical protein